MTGVSPKKMLISMILVGRLFVFLSIILVFNCCKNYNNIYSIKGQAQGTTYYIKYLSSEPIVNRFHVDSLLKIIDFSMSTYNDKSIVSLLNNGKNVELDTLIKKVIERSVLICSQTNGAFDITVAPIVNQWGFGPKRMQKKVSTLADSPNLKGCNKLSLYNDSLIMIDNVNLDLNGIAQGFSVDYVSDFLLKQNIVNFMVEIGGEVRCSGSNLGKPWKIAIDKPKEYGDREFAYILQVNDLSISTSGSYRNFYYTSDSSKITHHMNPIEMKPAFNNLISATVLSKYCMDADAYSTACMAVGLEGSKKFLTEHEISACLMYLENQDTVSYFSGSFLSFLHSNNGSAPQ